MTPLASLDFDITFWGFYVINYKKGFFGVANKMGLHGNWVYVGFFYEVENEGFVVARTKMSGTESPAITHHSCFMSTPANESLLFLIFLTEGENTA